MKRDERLVAQGERLRKFRESHSRSTEDVASLLGLGNRQSVYDLESGRRDLKAYEAMQLAGYYGVAPEVLLSGDQQSGQVFWRGEADSFAENLLRTRLDRYERLLSLSCCSASGGLPAYDLSEYNSFESMEQIADGIHKQLDLGQYPARILEEVLRKNWNVLVFHVPLESGSGACLRRKGLSAILLNSNEVWWRRNFSLGHELFHLIFNDCDFTSIPEKRVETLANIFSSHLLMPDDSIRRDIGEIICDDRIRYFDLISLSREYMVSTEALLWRLCRVGMINKETVESFIQNEELRELDRNVHSEVHREEPLLPGHMVTLAYRVYLNGRISVGKLAEYLETTVGQLKSVLRSYGIDPFAVYYETMLGNS